MDISPAIVHKVIQRITTERKSYDKAKKRYYKKLSPDFSPLSLFKINENTISKCLAFLLDPTETHAQGKLFTQNFYKYFIKNNKYQSVKSVCLEQAVERDDSYRRLDIFVETSDLLIGIENKPWAEDEENQLYDYGCWLKKRAGRSRKKWILFYLSNSEYSEYSLSKDTDKEIKDNIHHITYYEIIKWLEECSYKIESIQVKMFIESIIKFINSEINYELNMELQDEIVEKILEDNDAISSALLISKSIENIKLSIMDEFITYIINKTDELYTEFYFDDEDFRKGKKESGFYVDFNDDSLYYLVFKFESSNLRDFYWGFERKNEAPKRNKLKNYTEIQSEIERIFPDYYVECQLNAEDYPWYAYSGESLNIPQNWNADDNIWLMLRDFGEDSFAETVVTIIKTISDEFDLELLE
ncbi:MULTISPECIES: PD-(D/E)XK nuclease family protein [Proteus]|uniref:PDDEXK-like family protein n=1 Tax=Proteus TaxID=583 RepID=UPI0015982E6B|nr:MULTISPECIES: PD-(D/E)XK nuclease family protein [Proteus]QKJ49320.1 PD-(D/E)XK nuclease family protein [Proteus vulgaris]